MERKGGDGGGQRKGTVEVDRLDAEQEGDWEAGERCGPRGGKDWRDETLGKRGMAPEPNQAQVRVVDPTAQSSSWTPLPSGRSFLLLGF